MKFWLCACFTVLLAACTSASSYEVLGSRAADPDYRRQDYEFTISRGGNAKVSIFIKAFSTDGKLGLCGYYVADGGKLAQDLVKASIQDSGSEFFLDGQKIGNLTFVYANEKRFSELDATAYCVRTKEVWKETFAGARFAITTPSSRGDY